jgi:DNA (cytosine-5)-methyltransferase 1
VTLRFAGLFAGIGGIERGLHLAGHTTELLCECWEPAQRVLAAEPEFANVPLHPDITMLESLPDEIDAVAAGFPCQDLSQAGMTAGIQGRESGLVAHLFKLLRKREDSGRPLSWIVIENVQNMLALDRGAAMRYLTSELEALGCRWAYRVVDSRFSGVPQRRRRVLLVASATDDPREVLFAADAGPRPDDSYTEDSFGFYWTEGLRGLGWAQDAIPTLKGGSTVGIPSPPAIWLPDRRPGQKFVTPTIEDAEALQGFPRAATIAADGDRRRNGPR